MSSTNIQYVTYIFSCYYWQSEILNYIHVHMWRYIDYYAVEQSEI